MRADIDDSGSVNNFHEGCTSLPGIGCQCHGAHSAPLDGMTRVVLTATPQKPVGSGGWVFEQTGTDEHGTPEGVAVAEPTSLLVYKKARVIALEKERASVLAAAASTGWDYSAELTTIDAEIEGLKA